MKRIDLTPLLTHSYSLADIREAYALFGDRRDGLIKVAIRQYEHRFGRGGRGRRV